MISQLPQSASRALREKVKSAKRRKKSSTRWLDRQLNDPYVVAAKKEGYRSRAAYKILEINEKFNILKPGYKVLELGSSPGAWTQVNVNKVGNGNVWCIDINSMDEVKGAYFKKIDIFDSNIKKEIESFMKNKVNIVQSDMASPSTGHSKTDHLRTMALCEASLEIAYDFLLEGGSFFAKVLQGGTENELLKNLKLSFTDVKHFKPNSSRKESSELYVIARDYKIIK